MAEWSMAVVLKTTEPETVPGVRIPLPPPNPSVSSDQQTGRRHQIEDCPRNCPRQWQSEVGVRGAHRSRGARATALVDARRHRREPKRCSDVSSGQQGKLSERSRTEWFWDFANSSVGRLSAVALGVSAGSRRASFRLNVDPHCSRCCSVRIRIGSCVRSASLPHALELPTARSSARRFVASRAAVVQGNRRADTRRATP